MRVPETAYNLPAKKDFWKLKVWVLQEPEGAEPEEWVMLNGWTSTPGRKGEGAQAQFRALKETLIHGFVFKRKQWHAYLQGTGQGCQPWKPLTVAHREGTRLGGTIPGVQASPLLASPFLGTPRSAGAQDLDHISMARCLLPFLGLASAPIVIFSRVSANSPSTLFPWIYDNSLWKAN